MGGAGTVSLLNSTLNLNAALATSMARLDANTAVVAGPATLTISAGTTINFTGSTLSGRHRRGLGGDAADGDVGTDRDAGERRLGGVDGVQQLERPRHDAAGLDDAGSRGGCERPVDGGERPHQRRDPRN